MRQPAAVQTSVWGSASQQHCPLEEAAASFTMPSWSLQALEAAPSFKYTRSGFLRAMSDAGLKPTVVYHNLTPAELYEKVRRLAQGPKPRCAQDVQRVCERCCCSRHKACVVWL